MLVIYNYLIRYNYTALLINTQRATENCKKQQQQKRTKKTKWSHKQLHHITIERTVTSKYDIDNYWEAEF